MFTYSREVLIYAYGCLPDPLCHEWGCLRPCADPVPGGAGGSNLRMYLTHFTR